MEAGAPHTADRLAPDDLIVATPGDTTAGAQPSPAYQPYPTSPPPPPGFYPSAAGTLLDPTLPAAPFGAPLAGWWQRVGALVLDVLILGVVEFVLRIVFVALGFGTTRQVLVGSSRIQTHTVAGAGGVVFLLLLLVITGAYFAYFNGCRTGQTPGNRAPGIAVRDVTTGEAIGLGRGFVRWLVRFLLYVALVVPGIVNDLFPLWDSKHQTIADKAARSVMIRAR